MQKQHVVYQRLSTNEQRKNDIYSLKRQDALIELIPDNNLSIEDVCQIDNEVIPEIFVCQNVTVIKRDLGVSSSLGMEDRPGLRYLCDEIRRGAVDTIYIIEVSRLFRDNKFLEAPHFIELCEKHGVKVQALGLEYDFSDKFCRRIFLSYSDFAGMERDQFAERTLFAKRVKRKEGRWAGGTIPIGYQIINTPHDLNTHHKYALYEPHANVVREVFKIALHEARNIPDIARTCRKRNVFLPPFAPDIHEFMFDKSGISKYSDKWRYVDEDGIFHGWWPSVSWIRGVLVKPFYYGKHISGGKLISEDLIPAIIDEQTSKVAQAKFANGTRGASRHVSETSQAVRGFFIFDCPHLKRTVRLRYSVSN